MRGGPWNIAPDRAARYQEFTVGSWPTRTAVRPPVGEEVATDRGTGLSQDHPAKGRDVVRISGTGRNEQQVSERTRGAGTTMTIDTRAKSG